MVQRHCESRLYGTDQQQNNACMIFSPGTRRLSQATTSARRSVTFANAVHSIGDPVQHGRSPLLAQEDLQARPARQVCCRNEIFIERLKQRAKSAPADIIRANVLAAKAWAKSRRAGSPTLSRQPAWTVFSPLESAPASAEADNKNSRGRYTGTGRHSSSREDISRKRDAEEREQKLDSRPPWRFPAPKTPAEFRRVGVGLPEDRLEELMTPWESKAETLAPWARKTTREWSSKNDSRCGFKPTTAATLPNGLFGPKSFFESVHYSTEAAAAASVAAGRSSPSSMAYRSRQRREASKKSPVEAATKLADLHFLNVHSHSKPSSCALDLLRDCLRDPPVKLGINFVKRKVPANLVEKYGPFQPPSTITPLRPLSADELTAKADPLRPPTVVELDPWSHRYKIAVEGEGPAGIFRGKAWRNLRDAHVTYVRSKAVESVDFDRYRQPLEWPPRVSDAKLQAMPLSQAEKLTCPAKWNLQSHATPAEG